MCNAKLGIQGTFTVIRRHVHMQSSEKYELPETYFPPEVKQGSDLPSYFSFHICKQISLFMCMLHFHIFMLFIVISQFQMATKGNVEMLTSDF